MDNELARIERLKELGTWKFQVKILIQAADAFEIINGSIQKPRTPTATGTDSAKLLAEYQKNLRTLWIVRHKK